jgi:ketosteroid isomerase-like protein
VPSDNVELIRRGYESFNRGDLDDVFALLDPEIEWVTADRVPFAGTYRGHDDVRGLLRDQQEVFGEITMEPYELFEKGDKVVAFVRQRARGHASGAEIEIVVGHLWTVRDGRAVRFEGFPEREKALEAADLPPRR